MNINDMTRNEIIKRYCEIQNTQLIRISQGGIYNQSKQQKEEGLDRSHFATWFAVYNVVNDNLCQEKIK